MSVINLGGPGLPSEQIYHQVRVGAALKVRFNDTNGFAGPGTVVAHEVRL